MIGKAILAVALLSAFATFYLNSRSETQISLEDKFIKFITEERKSYFSQSEYKFRLGVFAKNLQKYEEQNADPLQTATFGVNKFADWTEEEFSVLLGIKELPEKTGHDDVYVSSEKVAGDWDWRTQGKLNPVKDQGSCGSCWAFAANGVHESTHAILKGGSVPDLSEQELVDCSWNYQNMGCRGGWYFWAWNYLKDRVGITLTSSYPYVGLDLECATSGKSRVSPITGYTTINSDDASIKNAVTQRPVAIAVDAGTWGGYNGGVMTSCGKSINHAVTLIGFNENDNAWIVRNSWGSRWGEAGHIRLAMGQNTCSMNNYVYMLNM